MNKYISVYSSQYPTLFEDKEVSSLLKSSFLCGKLDLDKESDHYPIRSDLKIMREDIVASIICIKSMLSDNGYDIDELAHMPIFVANGAFMDKPEIHLKRMSQMYNSFTDEMTPEQKKKKTYRMIPPLLALETLTNSSMSFIAQYIGLKGQNTTYGNTSIGAYYAINQALIELEKGIEKNVLVCGVNCGDTYSFLSNFSVLGKYKYWKESAGTGNFIISNSSNSALCQITHANSDIRIPDLENSGFERNWEALIPDQNADLLIFSGAFTQDDHEVDLSYVSEYNKNTYSHFESYGNLGAANLTLGIIHGIEKLSTEIKCVDIVDRDVYGRESLVRIEKC